MDLPQLITALGDPRAYPHAVEKVEVRQTHISVVFLAGPFVYKVKKPVNLGFLDFSSLAKRRHFCAKEVRLNRRLSPHVYLGVVPIVAHAGGVRIEGDGPAIEWAVKMARLPDDATLERRLERGELAAGHFTALARVVAGFHAAAERSAHIASFGRFDVVAGNVRENFKQSEPEIGRTIHPQVHARLCELAEAHLERLGPLIEARAGRGMPCDTHGDLHLDHVYLFPDRTPPEDLAIIDCIEFNERFRFADPVADMSFLAMDLKFHGRSDLARAFADVYFTAAKDSEGRALLPFYIAYRAAVRGKVEGMELRETEVPADEKARALTRARAHWLLALGELEELSRRPCLLLVGGLPGSGKSTLARDLSARAGFTVLNSDRIRKELAGLPAEARGPVSLYTDAVTESTYAECLRRAEVSLFRGERVIIDASFRQNAFRQRFLHTARRLAVPTLWLECQADPAVCRRRLAGRHGDVSDADWAIYELSAEHWEAPSPDVTAAWQVVDANGSSEQVAETALRGLRECEFA
jgi:aminoglycoside phosphotransferase family enzyme/predicted kinase